MYTYKILKEKKNEDASFLRLSFFLSSQQRQDARLSIRLILSETFVDPKVKFITNS